MDYKQSATSGIVVVKPGRGPTLDKNRILDLLKEKGPLSQEQIRAELREYKTTVKSALGAMAAKKQIIYSQRDGLWRLR